VDTPDTWIWQLAWCPLPIACLAHIVGWGDGYPIKTLGYLWPLVWRNTLRYCALRRILHNGDGLLPNYRRYRVAGGTYFFTVNQLERYPNDTLVQHIELLRGVVRTAR
jgi:hypothetical protein